MQYQRTLAEASSAYQREAILAATFDRPAFVLASVRIRVASTLRLDPAGGRGAGKLVSRASHLVSGRTCLSRLPWPKNNLALKTF